MKLKLISDTHFGAGRLTRYWNDAWRLTVVGDALVRELKLADVLVLLGDIFEGSVCAPWEGMDASEPFFKAIVEQTNIKSIIYCTGNHDHFVHQKLMNDLSIDNKPRRAPEFYVPCTIHGDNIYLPKIKGGVLRVDELKNASPHMGKYDDWQEFYNHEKDKAIYVPDIKWLSKLTNPNDKSRVPWIVCGDLIINDTILAMHGHQFDAPWGGVAHDLLYILTGRKEFADISEFYEYMNIPLTISGNALGSAGRATSHIREFQKAWNGQPLWGVSDESKPIASNHMARNIEDTLIRATEILDAKTDGNWWQESIEKQGYTWLVSKLMEFRGKQARGDREFPETSNLMRYHNLIRFTPTNSYTTILGHSHIPVVDYNFHNVVYNTGAHLDNSGYRVVTVDTITGKIS